MLYLPQMSRPADCWGCRWAYGWLPASKIKDFEGGFQSLSKSKTGKMFIEQVRVVAGDMQSVDDLARFNVQGLGSTGSKACRNHCTATTVPPLLSSAPLAVYTRQHCRALYCQ